ncbi:hypothetical protein [Sphingomonas sp.]|uniref:hypothetical protein n=1 Tax=Sphingomonas sp. TaxID=28214 RepID=UPI002B5782AC|nr:hypothetical protein [Sphingomonas sp.]HWK36103.1 hypothetical protein [Sphingomonas sp.]
MAALARLTALPRCTRRSAVIRHRRLSHADEGGAFSTFPRRFVATAAFRRKLEPRDFAASQFGAGLGGRADSSVRSHGSTHMQDDQTPDQPALDQDDAVAAAGIDSDEVDVAEDGGLEDDDIDDEAEEDDGDEGADDTDPA